MYMNYYDYFKILQTELGVNFHLNKEIKFIDGSQIKVPLLIENIGDINGMIITENFNMIAPYVEMLNQEKYGYSVFDYTEICSDKNIYDWMELCKEWGWFGDLSKMPKWFE